MFPKIIVISAILVSAFQIMEALKLCKDLSKSASEYSNIPYMGKANDGKEACDDWCQGYCHKNKFVDIEGEIICFEDTEEVAMQYDSTDAKCMCVGTSQTKGSECPGYPVTLDDKSGKGTHVSSKKCKDHCRNQQALIYNELEEIEIVKLGSQFPAPSIAACVNKNSSIESLTGECVSVDKRLSCNCGRDDSLPRVAKSIVS